MKTTMLHCQGLLTLEHAGPSELHCRSGVLWITEDGRDLIVHAGERCPLRGGGKVLVQAMALSHFSIESPGLRPRGGWLGRLVRYAPRFGQFGAARYAQ
ncbi:DUF2917 domain-containing protein [Chitiniphilus eburneus]|uniref:DUF2917 domain-containing protein n=1 Tax=Chitiniphilus eburneus TaxID=2571148 RepID=UPI0035CE9D36